MSNEWRVALPEFMSMEKLKSKRMLAEVISAWPVGPRSMNDASKS
jgi:hypothetical protein